MKRVCRAVVVLFGGLYLTALVLFLIGTFGLFGSSKGPMAGIFLIPIGLPWNLILGGLPSPILPWVAAGAPFVNLLMLWGLCRFVVRG